MFNEQTMKIYINIYAEWLLMFLGIFGPCNDISYFMANGKYIFSWNSLLYERIYFFGFYAMKIWVIPSDRIKNTAELLYVVVSCSTTVNIYIYYIRSAINKKKNEHVHLT